MFASISEYLVCILALALLMVIHEGGHYLSARAFGMRVTRFSIGFGPAIWKHTPKDGETTWQVAILPFLAYVQIAGMNPLEEIDPDDRGSYANATLPARMVTIFAGSAANYLFASVFFFAGLAVFGKPTLSPRGVTVEPGAPAAVAGIQSGDTVTAVAGEKVGSWEQMRATILAHPNETIDVEIRRGDATRTVRVTPEPKGEKGGGRIGIAPGVDHVPASVAESARFALQEPARVVVGTLTALGRIFSGREKAELSGPVGIVKEARRALVNGTGELLYLLGAISAYLGAFNLLPFPALDGGRLVFLGYEAITRRRPNARFEAQVHTVGLLMFLALMVWVTVGDVAGRR